MHPLLNLSEAPRTPSKSVQWGLGDALGWFMLSQFGSAIWFLTIVSVFYDGTTPDPIPVVALFVGQIALWLAYGAGPLLSARFRGNGARHDLGALVERNDVPLGLVLGLITQLAILPLLYIPITRLVEDDPSDAARELIDRADGTLDRLMLAFMVVVMAPLVEELFYRGLLLRVLQRHLGDWTAIVGSSALFALAHFQLLQLPGLFVFGLVSGFLAVRTGRLGPSWLFHAGFNATTLAVLLLSS